MANGHSGFDGRGVLHHPFGHGEYLDVFAIRKARIAAGVEDELKSLSVEKLILKGFVVDMLPFEDGLLEHLTDLKFAEGDKLSNLPQKLLDTVKSRKKTSLQGEAKPE